MRYSLLITSPYYGLKLIIWCITFYYCTLRILCWLSNVFSLQNSIQFTLLKEKMIGRKWCSKRGRLPFPGGRWMFRREMGSKRGSLPPKEGDLTCMRTCTRPHHLLHLWQISRGGGGRIPYPPLDSRMRNTSLTCIIASHMHSSEGGVVCTSFTMHTSLGQFPYLYRHKKHRQYTQNHPDNSFRNCPSPNTYEKG